jgi:hypothetical protein
MSMWKPAFCTDYDESRFAAQHPRFAALLPDLTRVRAATMQ